MFRANVVPDSDWMRGWWFGPTRWPEEGVAFQLRLPPHVPPVEVPWFPSM